MYNLCIWQRVRVREDRDRVDEFFKERTDLERQERQWYGEQF